MITALEEPEAFLHPAAQRTLARQLFSHAAGKRLVSTHSPILIEEAGYGDVVVVHDREFHRPTEVSDDKREEINTALLTRYGAEMVFARSILLVEGESDREFFENLRRRLAVFDESGRVDRLTVIPTGSKNFFAPWMRLIRSYGSERTSPFEWLALFDGDAPGAIEAGCSAASVPLSKAVRRALSRLSLANGDTDLEERLKAARQVNRYARESGTRIAISPGDLEYACLCNVTDSTAERLAAEMDLRCNSGDDLIRELGSKQHERPKAKPHKQPWRRALLGRGIPFDEVSRDTLWILRRWMGGAMAVDDAREIVSAARRDD